MKCCICGPVKNCGKFLDKVFKNIEQELSLAKMKFSNKKKKFTL